MPDKFSLACDIEFVTHHLPSHVPCKEQVNKFEVQACLGPPHAHARHKMGSAKED